MFTKTLKTNPVKQRGSFQSTSEFKIPNVSCRDLQSGWGKKALSGDMLALFSVK